MNRIRPFLIGMMTIALAGCFGTQQPDIEPGDTAGTTGGDTVEETRNVLYRGQLEEAGVTIFMQGSHKLTLDDGRFILLESEDVDLDDYLGEDVEVFGSVRPTVEAGGMIMRVESIMSLEESSASSSDESDASAMSESSPLSSGTADVPSDSSDSSVSPEPPASSVSSAPLVEASGELSAKAQLMAGENVSAENWTQQYCSTHIGFCIPVHRNWWFKSFGTTSSALWHLEIGPSEMNNLGEGPITVRLVSGDIASAGMSDGVTTVQGNVAVGARAWAGNRHFEVRGPAILEGAVRYITEHLEEASA